MEKGTLLLVENNLEDEAICLRGLREHAEADQVVVARDGAEALDYLFATGKHAGRVPSGPPVAVLLSLDLPQASGLEVLRRVRANARTRFIPIVLVTSSHAVEDRNEGYRSGCNSFVRKPVAAAVFQAAVSQLGMYWLLLNEPRSSGRAN